MPDDTYPLFTDPQGNTPGEKAQLWGSILGNRGLLGRSLTGFGALANRRAYEQFEQANRDKQLDLFERHGLISKDDRPYYKGLPTAAWDPIGQKFEADLATVAKPRAPIPFLNAQGQVEYHTPQEGQVMRKGLLPPSVLNAEENRAQRTEAGKEHEREFGINKSIQQQQYDAMNQLRAMGIDSNNAMRMMSLMNLKQQQAFMDQMAKMRLTDQQQSRFANEEKNLLDQQKSIAAMSAAKGADPTTIATMQAKQNAAMKAFKARADAAGYETSSEFDPLSVQDKPGAMQKLFGVGPMGSSLVPAGVSGAHKMVRSKSGRMMVPDSSSPSGYRYAD